MKRRDVLQGLAAMLPASSMLGRYSAMAEPLRKKVKITDLKAMVIGRSGGNTLVRIDTDAGVSGYGETYWGFGIKDVMMGYLRDAIMGEDPLDIDPLYTKMILRTGGAGRYPSLPVRISIPGAVLCPSSFIRAATSCKSTYPRPEAYWRPGKSQIWLTSSTCRYVPTMRLVRSELSPRRTARQPCAISRGTSSASGV